MEGFVEGSRRPCHQNHHQRKRRVSQIKALRDDIVSDKVKFEDVAFRFSIAAPPSAAKTLGSRRCERCSGQSCSRWESQRHVERVRGISLFLYGNQKEANRVMEEVEKPW